MTAIGLIAAIGQLFVITAINRAPKSLLVLVSYTETVSGTVLGYLVFNGWPDTYICVGIELIVVSISPIQR